jgi:hypothetical protein
LFGFVEGVIRWNVRVTGYMLTLVTDLYPAVPAGRIRKVGQAADRNDNNQQRGRDTTVTRSVGGVRRSGASIGDPGVS